ncbi:hypothetical protein CS0771_54980 [Catellatospora sp. IY07-71]|uniref:hypothetical protein n=1 Tax=Catellatospora sp. IY07-71 TaxID=2728827 RepID=UPI001BB33B14|nr:hypothetical protein [Catellatospora sp. IY07-71]BCJ75954.1 hypothetical protein CS0771_54980 [Catellatospora sp. IY07-71]
MSPDMINYAPLHVSPSPADAANVLTAARRGDLGEETARHIAGAGARSSGVGCLVGGFLAAVMLVVLIGMLAQGDAEGLLVGAIFLVGALLLGVAVKLLGDLGERRSAGRLVRLVAFAQANGLPVEPEAPARLLPGSIFLPNPHARTMHRVQWPAGGLSFEVATHTRQGRGQGTLLVRCLAVHLDVDPPRLTFHPGRPGGVRPAAILGTDAFEGEKCALYARTRDHAGARAFMTDDLVALLDDHERPMSAEVIDGWFLAYFRNHDELDEQGWRQAFAVAEAVVHARDAFRAWEPSRQSSA